MRRRRIADFLVLGDNMNNSKTHCYSAIFNWKVRFLGVCLWSEYINGTFIATIFVCAYLVVIVAFQRIICLTKRVIANCKPLPLTRAQISSVVSMRSLWKSMSQLVFSARRQKLWAICAGRFFREQNSLIKAMHWLQHCYQWKTSYRFTRENVQIIVFHWTLDCHRQLQCCDQIETRNAWILLENDKKHSTPRTTFAFIGRLWAPFLENIEKYSTNWTIRRSGKINTNEQYTKLKLFRKHIKIFARNFRSRQTRFHWQHQREDTIQFNRTIRHHCINLWSTKKSTRAALNSFHGMRLILHLTMTTDYLKN